MPEYFVWGNKKGKKNTLFQSKHKSKKLAIKARKRARDMGYDAHLRRVDRPIPKEWRRKK